MDETLLKARTQKILICLAIHDPGSKTDFMLLTRDFVRKLLLECESVPHEITDKRIFSIIRTSTERLVLTLEKDNQWEECIGSWYAEDIYEALQHYVVKEAEL